MAWKKYRRKKYKHEESRVSRLIYALKMARARRKRKKFYDENSKFMATG